MATPRREQLLSPGLMHRCMSRGSAKHLPGDRPSLMAHLTGRNALACSAPHRRSPQPQGVPHRRSLTSLHSTSQAIAVAQDAPHRSCRSGQLNKTYGPQRAVRETSPSNAPQGKQNSGQLETRTYTRLHPHSKGDWSDGEPLGVAVSSDSAADTTACLKHHLQRASKRCSRSR